jgi:uncharacterized membrane protein YfcA
MNSRKTMPRRSTFWGTRMATLEPCAFAGAFNIQAVGSRDQHQTFVKAALGVALLIAAATYVLRIFLSLRERHSDRARLDPDPPIRPLSTIAVGAVGGLLVGLTSVRSGSVIMVPC